MRRRLTIRYRRELRALPETYAASLVADLSELARVIERLASRPLVVVGSGGSFSGAVFAATLHELHGRRIGKAVTPLQVATAADHPNAGLLCLSASGRNQDIRTAFTNAARLETAPLAALCLSKGSPLKALQ